MPTVLDSFPQTLIIHSDEEIPGTGFLPPKNWDSGNGEGGNKKTLFVCADTVEACEDILSYIDMAIEDIRLKVRIIFCTNPEALATEIFPFVTADTNRIIAGVCLRRNNIDIDGFFSVLSSVACKLIPKEKTHRTPQDLLSLLVVLLTFGESSDIFRSLDFTKVGNDYLDLRHEYRDVLIRLEDVFNSRNPTVDLANPKFQYAVKAAIEARICGDI